MRRKSADGKGPKRHTKSNQDANAESQQSIPESETSSEEALTSTSEGPVVETAPTSVSEDSSEAVPITSTWILWPSSPHRCAKILCRFGNCGRQFDAPHSLRRHILQHHMPSEGITSRGTEENECCGVVGCQYFYTDIAAYRRHVTFHIYHFGLQWDGAGTLLNCDRRCNHNLESANNVFYSGDTLHCSWDECQQTFDDVPSFFTHVTEHGKALENPGPIAKDQKFVCLWTNCDYSTKRKYEITSHLRHHSGEKVVSCPGCGAFFANKTKLIDHCARQSPVETSRLKCMLCNKVFSSERLLREHGRRHINNYKCVYCGLSLPSPYNLRYHIMHRHNDVAAYVCSTCGKGFKTPLDLERHFAKHSKTANHECRNCGKKFKWLQSLQAHERQHYQVEKQPYICHLCPKKFGKGAFLSSHFVKVHELSLPPGHSRFTYKKCSDGYYRVILERYESIQLTEAVQQ